MNVPINSNNVKVTSYYGNRTYTYQGREISDFHKGIDLIGGSEILAFADGEVVSLCNSGVQYGQACYVRLKHNNGYQTLYYHLKSGSVCVSVGQKVLKGQKLGIMGATGQATGIHLHFQIDKGSSASAINPYDYLFNGKEFISNNISNNISNYSDVELANIVIQGKFGNGQDRVNALGDRYSCVQAIVNNILKGNNTSFDLLDAVKKTIRGDYGNGQDRVNALGKHYNEVQNQVNLNYKNGTINNIRLY